MDYFNNCNFSKHKLLDDGATVTSQHVGADVDAFLTVRLSITLVINQLNAQILVL